ncbi:MAG: 4a-hydroxytetrahydrobiopterin dehydratase [Alphaproteobacteria bacterium]
MSASNLANQDCIPCKGDQSAMSKEQAREHLPQVPGWQLNETATALQRKLTFKGFAKAVYAANAAAHLSDQTGHHADVRFGWGYCEITYTTHEIGGLSKNDFICAAKLNARLNN